MMSLKGSATGIGSLPHEDVNAALDLVFKHASRIPFWPQLPQRDFREGMIAQFSQNLPCLRLGHNSLFADTREKEEELEVFYERVIAKDEEYFKITPDFALGLNRFYQRLEKVGLEQIEFIKGQVTGPFTFAASVKDEQGIALLHDPVFMQAITKGLLMKALWQVMHFERFGKKVLIFIDEPYLGCFGSAYTPINREDVLEHLGELCTGIKAEQAHVGVHCCGNTDWSIFTDIEAIDVISFDAFSFLDRFVLYADSLKVFLERGGLICWGIIPTQLFSGEETADLIVRKLKEGIAALVRKGVDEKALTENLLISPSCGLGTFTSEKAEHIFRLLSEVSGLIREYM